MEQDELYSRAEFLAQTEKYFCVSNIQRNLMIGYNRAKRLMDKLVENKIVEQYETEHGIGYKRVTHNLKLRGSP